jgi:ribosomal protein L11 methylase PrmA
MFKGAMGIYPEPLALVMADDVPGETKAVLDLGCGSGSW